MEQPLIVVRTATVCEGRATFGGNTKERRAKTAVLASAFPPLVCTVATHLIASVLCLYRA